LHDFVEMATTTETTYPVYPPFATATKLADGILEYCTTNGLDDTTVNTPNGAIVKVYCTLKAETVYKVCVMYDHHGHIKGQIMINEKAAGKKTYWNLLEKLADAGFRMGLTVENIDGAPVREHFKTEMFNRIDIIKIKTANLKPLLKTDTDLTLSMFHKFFDTIIDFEQLERIPISRAPTTETKLSATAPAWVPQEPPLPTAADWVPLPSRATATATNTTTTTTTTRWVDDVVDDDDAQMNCLSEQIAKLEQQRAKLEQKKAEAERQKKLDAFKAQQAAALAEFKKSLL
jgi:hypothetical protein